MSRHIIIKSWSGTDAADASRKLAKIFRMNLTQSGIIMKKLAEGTYWQFEHTISEKQASTAQAFLERIQFAVEILPAAPSRKEETTAKEWEQKPLTEPETPEPIPSIFKKEKSPSLFPKEFVKPQSSKVVAKAEETQLSKEKKSSFLSSLPLFEKKEEEQGNPSLKITTDRKPWLLQAEEKTALTEAEKELSEPFRKGFSEKESAEDQFKVKSSPVKFLSLLTLILMMGSLVGLPYWVGMKIEKRFNSLPMAISDVNGTKLINKRFERGWFYSTAGTILKLKELPVDFHMKHYISHGPLLIQDILKGDPKKILSQLFVGGINDYIAQMSVATEATINLSRSQTLGPIKIKTKVNFKGQFHSRFAMDAFELNTQKLSLRWGGFSGKLTMPKNRKVLRGTAQILPLVLSRGKNQFFFKGIRASVNFQQQPSKFYHINSQLIVDQLKLENPDTPITLKNVQLSLNSNEKNENEAEQASARVQIEKLEIPNAVYGPGTLNFQMRNLDTAALIKINSFLRSKNDQKKKLVALDRLIKSSPEVEVNQFQIEGPEGNFEGHVKLSIDGKKADLLNNFSSIFGALHGEFSLSVPKSILEKEFVFHNSANPSAQPLKINFPIQNYLKQGYLEQKRNLYSTFIAYQNGRLKINKKSLQLFK